MMMPSSLHLSIFRRKINFAKPEDQAPSGSKGKEPAGGPSGSKEKQAASGEAGPSNQPKGILKTGSKSQFSKAALKKPEAESSDTKRVAITSDKQIHFIPTRHEERAMAWSLYLRRKFDSYPLFPTNGAKLTRSQSMPMDFQKARDEYNGVYEGKTRELPNREAPHAPGQDSASSLHGPELSRTNSDPSLFSNPLHGPGLSRTDSDSSRFSIPLHGPELSRTDSDSSRFSIPLHGPELSRTDSMDSLFSLPSPHGPGLSRTESMDSLFSLPSLHGQGESAQPGRTLESFLADARQGSPASPRAQDLEAQPGGGLDSPAQVHPQGGPSRPQKTLAELLAKERPTSLTHGSGIRAGFARMTGKVTAFFRNLPALGVKLPRDP